MKHAILKAMESHRGFFVKENDIEFTLYKGQLAIGEN